MKGVAPLPQFITLRMLRSTPHTSVHVSRMKKNVSLSDIALIRVASQYDVPQAEAQGAGVEVRERRRGGREVRSLVAPLERAR